MKKLLIQVGVVVSLAGGAALPAQAEHQDFAIALHTSRAIVHYNDDYRRYDRHNYRYDRSFRHALKHKRKHYRQHRRSAVGHNRWHGRNDDRWDGYYYKDHADLHHDQRRGHRNFHGRQQRH